MGEVLRLASLVDTLAEPLVEGGFEPLLIYANGLNSLICGDLNCAKIQLELFNKQQYQVEIAGVNLDILTAYKLVDPTTFTDITRIAKILVVHEDPALRNLILRFLNKQGYLVEAAEDGKTSLSIFEQFDPDLVILDVNLPDVTGFNLCQEMQSRNGVFVIMLTKLSDEADKIRGFSKGADDYITIPFSLQELEARVKAVLRRERIISYALS
ncbi:hypothetical protein CK510_08130 [Brunnivagina elsteri CCALA 953]|uniref:Response regulatory domain-containing protein n=1 Tax=Brunnivagina elsteri CCALA 953 TaxID=987040 RepID=A0A2A2TLM7_9CYAN|nr:hypothetical protein CK510_08130 [Calothrix elsteri CCALA 953]